MYDTAVMLSPNAAHLWNERGNAFAADGDDTTRRWLPMRRA